MDKDLGPLPQVDSREIELNRAALEPDDFLLAWQDKHKITASEFWFELSSQLVSQARWCVKRERMGYGNS